MSDGFIPPLHDTDTDDDPYSAIRAAAKQWKVVEQQRRNANLPEVDGRAPLVRDETDGEKQKRELRERADTSQPPPLHSPGHPSFAKRVTGKVAKGVEAVKRVFTAPRPKAFALQFNRHAVLIDISDDMLTDEEIRALQEKAAASEVRVVPLPACDVRLIREGRAVYARCGRALNKDGVLQLRLWARQIRDRAMMRGEPISEPLSLADLSECWQPPRSPAQPKAPPPTRPPQKQVGSNIDGIPELSRGRWGER